MKRDDMEELEAKLLQEVAKRRRLGEFDANAAAVLLCMESCYEILRHIREATPRGKE